MHAKSWCELQSDRSPLTKQNLRVPVRRPASPSISDASLPPHPSHSKAPSVAPLSQHIATSPASPQYTTTVDEEFEELAVEAVSLHGSFSIRRRAGASIVQNSKEDLEAERAKIELAEAQLRQVELLPRWPQEVLHNAPPAAAPQPQYVQPYYGHNASPYPAYGAYGGHQNYYPMNPLVTGYATFVPHYPSQVHQVAWWSPPSEDRERTPHAWQHYQATHQPQVYGAPPLEPPPPHTWQQHHAQPIGAPPPPHSWHQHTTTHQVQMFETPSPARSRLPAANSPWICAGECVFSS